jgi:hypothetical protein
MRKEPSTKVTVLLPDRVLAGLREAGDAERRSLTATLVVAAEAYLRQRGGLREEAPRAG